MTQVEIFIGSPRKKGNTFSLAQAFSSGLDRDKFTTGVSFLYDYEIKPCVDCRACKKGDLECVLVDGMAELYSKLDLADIIVIGTPIYWFGPSAQTKLLLDRLRPYYGNKQLTGKKAVLLLPAGSGPGDCDLTIEMFRRSFEALGVKLIGSITSEAFDVGDSEKDQQAAAANIKLTNLINGDGLFENS